MLCVNMLEIKYYQRINSASASHKLQPLLVLSSISASNALCWHFTVTKLLDNSYKSRATSGHIQFQKTKTISTKDIEEKPG
jgi:hypothetical protein